MATAIKTSSDSTFTIDGITFKVYGQRGMNLWVDGGENDDLLIRNLPEFDDADEATITVTDADLQEARDYIEYLAEEVE